MSGLLIYGANGYSGRLIAAAAVARGLRPVLAGRDRDALDALAAPLGLTRRVFGLDDPATVARLLKAGVDFKTISDWLGHANLNTTMRYARSDLDLKRQALSQVFPDILAPNEKPHVLFDPDGLARWLRRL